ncbi:MAG: transporter substrate-binding domain-containing protein [Kordiimonadaceae bacterium]|nr:transporter substrate-binding domain-containing protein [Kordiimonadaceae bacterium]
MRQAIFAGNMGTYMQQIIKNSIFIICAMTIYAQSSNGQTLTPEELAWIAEHPVVKTLSSTSYAPFDFMSGGLTTGLSIDYLNLVGTKVGLKFEYVRYDTWPEMLEGVQNKEIDLTHSISKSEQRSKYLNFSAPYYNSPIVYFGRAGSPRVSSIEDINDKRIGVIRGHIIGEVYKKKHPQINLIEFENNSVAINALLLNEIDIFVADLPTVNFYISQSDISGLETLGDDLVVDKGFTDQRIAVHKDNPTIMAIINKGMAAITDEEFAAISDKWIKSSPVNYDIGLTNEELDWLSLNRVIKVGVDPTIAPQELIDENGNISGIAGDYLDIIAEKLNIEFEWAGSRNWSEALSMVQNGEVDMLTTVVSTPSRREYLLFTEKYTLNPNVIFTKTGGNIFGNLVSLSGYKVAQVIDFSVTEFLRTNYPDIEIIEVSTSDEAIQKVSSGEVDAFISVIPIGIAAITEAGVNNIIISGDASDFNGGNSMATRMDLPLLASALQKALDSVSTVQRNEIIRRWQSAQVAVAPDYKLLIQLGLIALAIIAAITIWAVSAHIEIRRRRIVENKLILSQGVAAKAQNEAEKANAEKSTLLANMSHEIRTPLNAIIGFSEMMSSEILGKINNLKYTEYLTDIKNSGLHLESVIKDILDLSKIEAGKWDLDESEFDLKTCIKDAIKINELHAKDKNISLKLKDLENENLIKIYGDETAYKRIFINLLSNSVKFTGNDGVITVSVSLGADGFCKIEIADNGVGIAADKIEDVLTPFSQAHDTKSSDNMGTGLGLPIVKRLAELHGGSFSLSSEENIGTTSTILIPAVRVISKDHKHNI